jgi:hypothetical protein
VLFISLVVSTTFAAPEPAPSPSIEARCLAEAKRQFPDAFQGQKRVYEEELEAAHYMQSVTNAELKAKVEKRWPESFVVQRIAYRQELAELAAKTEMQRLEAAAQKTPASSGQGEKRTGPAATPAPMATAIPDELVSHAEPGSASEWNEEDAKASKKHGSTRKAKAEAKPTPASPSKDCSTEPNA